MQNELELSKLRFFETEKSLDIKTPGTTAAVADIQWIFGVK